jgi:hypothetical protein
MPQPQGVSLALNEFLGTGPPVVALLGAGISRPAPSSIPLASELADIVLTRLATIGEIPQDLVDHVRRGVRQVGMPLEYVAQVLYGSLGRQFLQLLVSCFPAPTPFNRFHWAMARAARRGRLAFIITLNWDELIEQALDAAGLQRFSNHAVDSLTGQYYRVLTGDDLADADLPALRTTRTVGDTLLLLKLHGTISQPETIRSTVESYQSWFSLDRDMNLVEFLRTRKCAVFVAGYSGRDEMFPRLFGRPGTGYRPERKPEQTVYWLDRPGAVLAQRVLDLLEEPGVTSLAINADDFAIELLRGDEPTREICPPPTSSASTFAVSFPSMQCYNALARLAVQLEQYGDTCNLIRKGFGVTRNDESQTSHWIEGLAVIGRAKAGLRDFEGAAADLDRAISDWDRERHEKSDWLYRHAEMRLCRGIITHKRNRHITDQLFAYDELSAAHKGFLDWHDQFVQGRNFESSPEYAMIQYYLGLFMVHGRDLCRAEVHFARLLDVDVFNDLNMARARKHHGSALCCQARGDLKGAITIAREGIRLVTKTYECFVHSDLLLLLASLHEAVGNRGSAWRAYQSLSERLNDWVGDVEQSRWAADKARTLRPFGYFLGAPFEE